MNSNTTDMENMRQPSEEQTVDLPELITRISNSRKLIFKVCGIGAILGVIIAFGTPREYTADILIVPEGFARSYSGMGALAAMTDIGSGASTATERDAIYPSLYPFVVNSTPFLIGMFDVEVRQQKAASSMPLSQYMQNYQKTPWWRVVTSAPSKLTGRIASLFMYTKEEKFGNGKRKPDPFRLTSKEAAMVDAIASRINIGVDKKKRVVTVSVTMQDPLIAATVADTVRMRLQEYITEYRISKVRKILEYTEQLHRKAQIEYYEAQNKYTAYADRNQKLIKLTSRAKLVRLQNDMNLAYATYNQMEQQLQVAKTKVEKMTPVHAIIQPAVVPITPSKPRKAQIIVVSILLSTAGSISWILFIKDFIGKIKKRIIVPVGK